MEKLALAVAPPAIAIYDDAAPEDAPGAESTPAPSRAESEADVAAEPLSWEEVAAGMASDSWEARFNATSAIAARRDELDSNARSRV